MSRRSKAQWRELISQQQLSELSAAEFCRRESINAKYFSMRKGQLAGASSAFCEVAPSSITGVKVTPERIKLRVIEFDVPTNNLSTVLKQLRE
jgi:hypothetical protein